MHELLPPQNQGVERNTGTEPRRLTPPCPPSVPGAAAARLRPAGSPLCRGASPAGRSPLRLRPCGVCGRADFSAGLGSLRGAVLLGGPHLLPRERGLVENPVSIRS